MYKKILIPLDGSELAESALEHGLKLAEKFGSEVYLLQVVMPVVGTLAPYELEYQFSESLRQQVVNQANEYLGQVAKKYEAGLGGKLHWKVIEGVVVDNILDYADFQGIDLIVMATHGRSGIGRWVFGSVAERVLRGSKCPIFLIRPVETDKEK